MLKIFSFQNGGKKQIISNNLASCFGIIKLQSFLVSNSFTCTCTFSTLQPMHPQPGAVISHENKNKSNLVAIAATALVVIILIVVTVVIAVQHNKKPVISLFDTSTLYFI